VSGATFALRDAPHPSNVSVSSCVWVHNAHPHRFLALPCANHPRLSCAFGYKPVPLLRREREETRKANTGPTPRLSSLLALRSLSLFSSCPPSLFFLSFSSTPLARRFYGAATVLLQTSCVLLLPSGKRCVRSARLARRLAAVTPGVNPVASGSSVLVSSGSGNGFVPPGCVGFVRAEFADTGPPKEQSRSGTSAATRPRVRLGRPVHSAGHVRHRWRHPPARRPGPLVGTGQALGLSRAEPGAPGRRAVDGSGGQPLKAFRGGDHRLAARRRLPDRAAEADWDPNRAGHAAAPAAVHLASLDPESPIYKTFTGPVTRCRCGHTPAWRTRNWARSNGTGTPLGPRILRSWPWTAWPAVCACCRRTHRLISGSRVTTAPDPFLGVPLGARQRDALCPRRDGPTRRRGPGLLLGRRGGAR